jgi:hypothetical protein
MTDVDFIIIHVIFPCFNIGVKLGPSFEMVNIVWEQSVESVWSHSHAVGYSLTVKKKYLNEIFTV